MDGEAGKFRFTANGTNYTQSDLSEIGVYPVNTSFRTGPNGVELFLVNGQVEPVINMTTDKWYHFRVVNTVMNYLLFWVKDEIVTQNCNIFVMRRDIVFNETRPRNINEWPYRNKTIVIPPGFAITFVCYPFFFLYLFLESSILSMIIFNFGLVSILQDLVLMWQYNVIVVLITYHVIMIFMPHRHCKG